MKRVGLVFFSLPNHCRAGERAELAYLGEPDRRWDCHPRSSRSWGTVSHLVQSEIAVVRSTVCDFFHYPVVRWPALRAQSGVILIAQNRQMVYDSGAYQHGQGNGGATMSRATYFVQECPTCGRSLQINVEHLGRQVMCQHCHGRFEASQSAPLEPRGADLLRRAEQLLESTSLHHKQPPAA